MNRQRLFLQIDKHVQRLTAQAASMQNYKIKHGSFDRQLFSVQGASPQVYLQEIAQHQDLFQHEQDVERAAWLAEKLINQITALQRELASQPVRRREKTVAPPPDNVAQHEEFARRLQEMIDQREVQLAQAETLAQQQVFKRELEALESRLQRCIQALNGLKSGMAAN